MTYNNKWKNLYPRIGFNPTTIWPNGTRLVQFGDSQMRVSVENESWLETLYGKNWRYIAKSHWYDHQKNVKKNTFFFELNSRLNKPATPFFCK